MAKTLLLSILIATVAIPMRFAKTRDPKAGLRKTLTGAMIYIAAWVFFLVYIFIRIISFRYHPTFFSLQFYFFSILFG